MYYDYLQREKRELTRWTEVTKDCDGSIESVGAWERSSGDIDQMQKVAASARFYRTRGKIFADTFKFPVLLCSIL